LVIAGRERNKEKHGTLPVGENAEEIMTSLLHQRPNDCSDEERETFLAFVDIGLAALNKRLLEPFEAKSLFVNTTNSDIAWAITNFKHYAQDDAPLEGQNDGRYTKRGNPSTRKNKRQKVANTKEVQNIIQDDYTRIVTNLDAYYQALDVSEGEERDSERVRRLLIKTAWADHLQQKRQEICSNRENVAPSNGGRRGQGGSESVELVFDISKLKRVAV
jgi:hypothetical protein